MVDVGTNVFAVACLLGLASLAAAAANNAVPAPKCEMTQTLSCNLSNETIVLPDSGDYVSFSISPSAGAQLSVGFSASAAGQNCTDFSQSQDHALCDVPVNVSCFLLSAPQWVEFVATGGSFSNAAAANVTSSVTGSFDISFQGSSGALKAAGDYRLVFVSDIDNEFVGAAMLHVWIEYDPLIPCLTTLLVVGAIVLGCLLVCLCFNWNIARIRDRVSAGHGEVDLLLERKNAKREAKFSAEDQARAAYPQVEPQPIGWLLRCTGGLRIPVLHREYISFKNYWKTTHAILWIRYPHPRESLTRNYRVLVTVVLVLFELLVQTLWANFFANTGAEAAALVSAGNSSEQGSLPGRFAVQVISGSTITTLVGLVYRPFTRFVTQDKRPWQDNDKQWMRHTGRGLFYLSWALAVGCLGGVAIGFGVLLDDYTCPQFVWAVFFPFIVSLVFSTVFPGALLSYAWFRFVNTFGVDIDESERVRLLTVQQI